MDNALHTCTVTDLRRCPSACVARARELGSPLFVTRRGQIIALLIPIEQYERTHHNDTLSAESLPDTPLACSLGCRLKGATVDETDYRRYLEEKYR